MKGKIPLQPLWILCLCFAGRPAWAGETGTGDPKEAEQAPSALAQSSKEEKPQETDIESLRKRVEELEKAAAEEAAKPATGGSWTDTLGRSIQSFNPDVSVIADLMYHAVSGERGELQPDGTHENQDRFQVRELELAFGAAVDPYARGDLFVHIHEHDGEWHAGLCEGYITFLTLPCDLQARAGKFRSRFGKAGTLHTHSMPWPDRPDMISNYFGEPGGINEEGVEISWLVPNPWDLFTEVSYSVQNNESPLFAGSEADDVVHVGHLKSFFELNEDVTMELGGSFAMGTNDYDHGRPYTNVGGVDLTFKYRPLGQELYQELIWQSEALGCDREESTSGEDVRSWAGYSSLEYRFSRNWKTFARYDYSQLPKEDRAWEHAGSLGIDFIQSEYCYIRLGVKHSEFEGASFTDAFGDDCNEVFVQLNFGLGPHRAHTY